MGVDYSITLTDNSDLYLNALSERIETALEAVGQQAESHAKRNLTAAGKRKTGDLINSMDHEVRTSEDAVYIGSNLEYAPYVEHGTGKFGDNGGTGNGWWVYVVGGSGKGHVHGKRYTEEKARQIVAILRAKGLDAHMTQGQKPTHFLKNAVTQHSDEYKAIIEQQLKNG